MGCGSSSTDSVEVAPPTPNNNKREALQPQGSRSRSGLRLRDTRGGGSGEAKNDSFSRGRQGMSKRKSLARFLSIEDEGYSTVRILVTGTRGSGKRTLLKQIRMGSSSSDPLTDEETRMYGIVIRANAVETMRSICLQLRRHQLEDSLKQDATDDKEKEEEAEKKSATDVAGMQPFEAYEKLLAILITGQDIAEDEQNSCDANDSAPSGEPPERDWLGSSPLLGDDTNSDAKLLLRHWKLIDVLWQSATVRRLWSSRRAGKGIFYSHRRYLDNMDRLVDPKYKPSNKDIMLARFRPTDEQDEEDEPTKVSFVIDDIEFELYNIGHELTEARRKWMAGFEDGFDALLFLVPLGDYDRWDRAGDDTGISDSSKANRVNRMVSSLEYFQQICDEEIISRDKVLLLFNKKDLLDERIERFDLESVSPFSDYRGPSNDADRAALYFIDKYKGCLGGELDTTSFVHVGSVIYASRAGETTNFLTAAMKAIIITDNLRRDGFLG